MLDSPRFTVLGALMVLALAPAAARAQGRKPQTDASRPTTADASTVTLVYDREVFTYTGGNRRDPFHPLTDDTNTGPRFDELNLQGIIYSSVRGRSLVLLGDAAGRVHRVRVGDVLGNTRIVEIGPLRVVFAVEEFGNVRQEMLELKKSGGGGE